MLVLKVISLCLRIENNFMYIYYVPIKMPVVVGVLEDGALA